MTSETSFARMARRPFQVALARFQKYLDDRESRDPEAWKRAYPLQPPAKDVVVRFVIPLISKTKANDWDVVCRNLDRTLASLKRQTNPNWRATIACQTRPDGICWDDQVRFLPFKIAPRQKGSDKPRKQRFLIRDAAQRDRQDGYLFFLDADDILHPRLVEHIVTDNNGHGYSITQGYMVDLSERRAVPLGIGTKPNDAAVKPFYKVCGSSSAIRFDLRQNKGHANMAYRRGSHGRLHESMLEFGIEMKPVPFPAALYVFNHGDNLQKHRGVEGGKLASLQSSTVADDLFAQVMREFALPDDPGHNAAAPQEAGPKTL